MFTCAFSAVAACARDLPAAIRVMQHVQHVWQSPSLGFETKPFRDLDSNKEHERTMRSWLQQIGWACEEANAAVFMLDRVSCGKVTLRRSGNFLASRERHVVNVNHKVWSPFFFYNEFLCVIFHNCTSVELLSQWVTITSWFPLQCIYIVNDCRPFANMPLSHFIPLNTERESIERMRLTVISPCTVLWKALQGLVGWC